ncbi:DUF2934 domain-containing protein [Methylobacterium sp. J-078]|uniref:DUF2934 domain-containing protein n=1 Tax=Methylobacterium sp. J-078 TaxID=2836657 RepID=UPI001FBAD065|nr:DUF2934 domain-containing protein [Methylobacterium sp. J-078]MCJ2046966.1 DUF2934 domain-containing protein [Methylobacterium sp. J-078]
MTQREQQVRERAYFIWEGEGRIFGRAEAHWLQAETELQASLTPAPLHVQTAAPDITLAPSPAQVLAESLKAKPSRTRSVTATVETKVKSAAAKASADVTPKPAKSAKSVAAKPPAGKTPSVKAEPAAKARAPKAAARPRAEAVASVH